MAPTKASKSKKATMEFDDGISTFVVAPPPPIDAKKTKKKAAAAVPLECTTTDTEADVAASKTDVATSTTKKVSKITLDAVNESEEPKKGKKGKKAVDGGASAIAIDVAPSADELKIPKGCMKAYMFFSVRNMPTERAATPDVAVKDIAKRLGEIWRSMDAEAKAEYEAMATADAERFKSDMAKYDDACARATKFGVDIPSPPQKKRKSKKDVKPKKVKRPANAYALYAKHASAEFVGIAFAERSAKVAQMWADLDAEAKAQWHALAADAKKAHQETQALEEHDADDEKPAKKKAKRDPNAPKRPPSAYLLYGKTERTRIIAENPEATFGDIAKLVAAEWAKLTEEDRKPYNDDAAHAHAKYTDEVQAYASSTVA